MDRTNEALLALVDLRVEVEDSALSESDRCRALQAIQRLFELIHEKGTESRALEPHWKVLATLSERFPATRALGALLGH